MLHMSKLSRLTLYAAIVIVGFGIERILSGPKVPARLQWIVVSFALFATLRATVPSSRPVRYISYIAAKGQKPVSLRGEATSTFDFFPGAPTGYAGHTDFTAMRVTINDDLATRSAREQFALLGFGNGFVSEILRRVDEERLEERRQFSIEINELGTRQRVGWLAHLQRAGIDNGGPSTKMLHVGLSSVCREVMEQGPITLLFWDKVHNNRIESLDRSRTTPAMLRNYAKLYEAAFAEGRDWAAGALQTMNVA